MKLFIYLLALVATATSETPNFSPTQLTVKMFQKVVKANPGENVVLSAISVLSPLTQLSLAAVGESLNEILQSLQLPTEVPRRLQVVFGVTNQIKAVKGVELRLANKVYVRKGEVLNEQYVFWSDTFETEIENIDFSNTVKAASEINTWVEDNTNQRIKNLISPANLDPSTAVAVVNAIYFKGMWKKCFNKTNTRDQAFFKTAHNVTHIPLMEQTNIFKFGESEELDAKLLELLYDGDQSSLLIVLPKQLEGINDLVEKLKNPVLLSIAVKNMKYEEVIVEIPKFKIETTTDLREVLQKMNIEKIFNPNEARLDNMLKEISNIFIGSAIQKAYIDVDEEGTEAAAFTYIYGEPGSSLMGSPKKSFKADHPFYFELVINNITTFNGVFHN